ncbi:plasmid stabilization system protein ParE [Pedobacter sp. CAN_A7]
MTFEIRFTREAEETYNALSTQLEQRWGQRFVKKLEDRISQCLHTISTSPYIYPIVQETVKFLPGINFYVTPI